MNNVGIAPTSRSVNEMNKLKLEKDLRDIQAMNYDDKVKVLGKLKPRMSIPMYYKYSTDEQISQLLSDWSLIVDDKNKASLFDGDIKSIQDKHLKKLTLMISRLIKKNRIHLIPDKIFEKYVSTK